MSNFQLLGTWNYPTKIIFGVGEIKQLPTLCDSYQMRKPLLVTDPVLVNSPVVQDTIRLLQNNNIDLIILSDVKSNPTSTEVFQGVRIYNQHQCDGVIAFGGGSSLDLGKTIALMSKQTLSLWDFADDGRPTPMVAPNSIATIIAIPTTAGTGSEVGRCTAIIDEEMQCKKLIFHPLMLPSVVICDPNLTLSLPAHLTAATGMDALSHCLEAYCVPAFHPMADGIAIQGMKMIKEYLVKAVRDPENMIARSNMLAAATMGATAFQKGLGAMHALAHPLGAIYDVHHGLLNAILMPYVVDFNKSVLDKKLGYLSRCLDLKPYSSSSIIKWIYQLRKAINIPNSLNAIGIDNIHIDEIIKAALEDPSAAGNPIKLDKNAVKTIFTRALNGTV